MSIFDIEGPLMRTLGKIADLMILNVLTLLCCLPVITGGAALTALHYMCLKMVRNEESYIVRGYFKSFKENLKQATLLWLLLLLAVGILAGDVAVMHYAVIEFPFAVRVAVLIVGLVVLCTALYLFPFQARFENPIKVTIRNAFMASLAQFPKTLLMLLLLFAGPLMIMVSERFAPVVFFFGISVHAYISALLYNNFFKKIEAKNPASETARDLQNGEDDRIFHDRPDVSADAGNDLKK